MVFWVLTVMGSGYAVLGLMVILAVLVSLCFLVVQYIRNTVSSGLEDDCPEAGCGGHLHYIEDVKYHGKPAALWVCRQCDYEVLRTADGHDIVRSTDPSMTT